MTAHLSKEFFDFIKGIGECKSKEEEDRIISKEQKTLKALLSGPLPTSGTGAKRVKELLVRLIYVEMLGHDASWGYVIAAQQTASHDLAQKRAGYLACSLMLSPDHEFRFMLVNQMQRDLSSANVLEANAALVALCKLVTVDMIPALLQKVQALLTHEQTILRKKAIIALHRFHQLDPSSVAHMGPQVYAALRDRDPSVMGAALCLLHDLARPDPASKSDVVPQLVSILKQIAEHRLPREFDYHRLPAPWIQIKLLQTLATLGQNDKKSSEQMYEVLGECLRRADTGTNIGFAVVYEVVKTITAIWPDASLLDAAATAISRFITSNLYNLKYLGVTGLAAIVRDHPRYAAAHQMAVIECLEDPDESLKRKTLELLFRMTNPVNAEVIVDKLLGFLAQAQDHFLRADIVSRVTQLAERYAPDNVWYIRTLTRVFTLAGDLVEPEVAHNLLRLLAEGSGEVEEGDEGEAGAADEDVLMRRCACHLFLDALRMTSRQVLPEILLKVAFWTLGEFAYLLQDDEEEPVTLEDALEVVCDAVEKQALTRDSPLGISGLPTSYGISSVGKICAQLGRLPPRANALLLQFSNSRSTDVMQRCRELLELCRDDERLETAKLMLPVDASCEDFEDLSFDFLDEFTEILRAAGAQEYSPELRDKVQIEIEGESSERPETSATPNGGTSGGLRFAAYEAPSLRPVAPPAAAVASATAASRPAAGKLSLDIPPATEGIKLPGGAKQVWGPTGYTGHLSGNLGGGVTMPSPNSTPPPVVGPATKVESASLDLSSMMPSSNHVAPEPAQAPPAAAAAPPKPRELTEREKMAAALFGGIVAPASNEKKPPARGSVAAKAKPAAPAARSDDVGDLLGSVEPSNVDLLGSGVNLMDLGGPSSKASAPTSAPSNSDNLMDLFTPAVSTPTTPAQPLHYPSAPLPTNSSSSSANNLFNLSGLTSGTPPPAAAVLSAPTTPLSPHAMTTAQFGGQWPMHPSELRFSVVSLSASTFNETIQATQSKLGASLVEFLPATKEAIFCGDVKRASDSGPQLVLIHAKERGPGMFDVMVRARTPEVADFVSKEIKARLT